jgi:hypothetical protein
MGPVRLTGSATGPVTWYVNAFDNDYAFVGSVFSVPGAASVDVVFTPGAGSVRVGDVRAERRFLPSQRVVRAFTRLTDLRARD